MRSAVAAVVLAALLAGCASRPDYGAMRRSRNERGYHGGAASVPDSLPPPERSPRDEARSTGAGLALLATVAAICLRAPISTSPVPSDPPTSVTVPPPSR